MSLPVSIAFRVIVIVAALLASTQAGCVVEDLEVVGAHVEVTDDSYTALTAGSVTAINGTYGAGCTARSGAWSVAVASGATLANPALSVVQNNSSCVLALTEIVVAAQTYTASPAILMTAAYQAGASAFTSGGSTAFNANARLSATDFAGTFVISLRTSADANSTTNTQAASMGCPEPRPVWLTGFESGAVSSAGATITPAASLLNTVAGTVSADTSGPRSGSYALRVAKTSGTTAYVAKSSLASGSILTLRFGIRFWSLPTANQTELAKIGVSTGSAIVIGYNNTAPKRFSVGFSGATLQMGPSAGLASNYWYRIDLRIDVGVNPHTVDWQVDGVAQTQATVAQAAEAVSGTVSLGSTVSADVFTASYDDVMVTTSGGDFPLPDGGVYSVRPDTYLSKNDPSSRLRNDDGTVVGAGSHSRLTEAPMTSRTNYIHQTAVDATAYAELGFGDVSRPACLYAVSAVVALHSSSTTTNRAKTLIREGGIETTIHDDDVSPGTSSEYRSKPIMPASGGWSFTKLAATTARLGYYSVSGGVPRWDAIMLEYDAAFNHNVDNPGFESGSTSWAQWIDSAVNASSVATFDSADARAGSLSLLHSSSAAYRQLTYQIRYVPNGVYTARAWVKSSGGQTAAALAIKQYGGSDLNTDIAAATATWTQYTSAPFTVSTGIVEVGLWSDAPSGGRWLRVNDVELVRQ